jgi:hypothetical protein
MRRGTLIVTLAAVALAAALLPQLAAGGARARTSGPAYYPFGPQLNVSESTIVNGGWVKCWQGLYGNGSSVLANVLTLCKGPNMLLAGGPAGSSVFDVIATAPRADVLFDTGTSNTPHNANGSGWYFNTNYSWGFAKQGDAINRSECDTNSTDGAYRLCWHTGLDYPFNRIDPGWRSGTNTDLNDSTTYRRAIFVPRVYKP